MGMDSKKHLGILQQFIYNFTITINWFEFEEDKGSCVREGEGAGSVL